MANTAPMKRWALLTAGLYAAALLLISVPVVQLAFIGQANDPGAIYSIAGYWVWLAFMVLCAATLLIAPVRLHGRPTRRGSLWWTFAGAGLALTLLLGGAFLALSELLRSSWPSSPASLVAITAALWLFWTVTIWLATRKSAGLTIVRRVSQALLAGSILELLVAVPCHVIVRQRNDCCAGLLTFVGLVTGISVMLLAFGPSVYFLFAERAGRIRQRPAQPRNPDSQTGVAAEASTLDT